jgi:hypothetical protein
MPRIGNASAIVRPMNKPMIVQGVPVGTARSPSFLSEMSVGFMASFCSLLLQRSPKFANIQPGNAGRVKRRPWTAAEPVPAPHVARDMSTKEPEPPIATKLPPKPVMPGGAAALPVGSLKGPFLGPQGDENRDPPADAPAPVPPAETVRDADPQR